MDKAWGRLWRRHVWNFPKRFCFAKDLVELKLSCVIIFQPRSVEIREELKLKAQFGRHKGDFHNVSWEQTHSSPPCCNSEALSAQKTFFTSQKFIVKLEVYSSSPLRTQSLLNGFIKNTNLLTCISCISWRTWISSCCTVWLPWRPCPYTTLWANSLSRENKSKVLVGEVLKFYFPLPNITGWCRQRPASIYTVLVKRCFPWLSRLIGRQNLLRVTYESRSSTSLTSSRIWDFYSATIRAVARLAHQYPSAASEVLKTNETW